jgi:uncharacterized protein YkwD
LRQRGVEAVADGALAELAQWALEEASRGRNPDAMNAEHVVRRGGFAGVVYAVGAYRESSDDDWKVLLDALADNLIVNRFGVVADDEGHRAIALGSMQAEFASVPRHVKPGDSVILRGKVSERFRKMNVFLTARDGSTTELPTAGRTVDLVIQLDEPGLYRLGLMGDGSSGPVVLANLPIYVGVEEPRIEPSLQTAGPIDPTEAQNELFELLNQARKKAHLRSLQYDESLTEIALGHSQDMARHQFFGHVSPRTGTPSDRMEHAGKAFSKFGENVARGPSAKAAHALLMASPGHRANMLRKDFTHVGIGVTTHAPYGRPELLATLLFSRRPSLAETLSTDEEALESLAGYRRAHGGSALEENERLIRAAKAGMEAFAERNASKEAAIDTSGEQLAGLADVCAAFVDVLEISQLENFEALYDPNLESLAVSLTARAAGDTVVLHVLMLFKARPGKVVRCE